MLFFFILKIDFYIAIYMTIIKAHDSSSGRVPTSFLRTPRPGSVRPAPFLPLGFRCNNCMVFNRKLILLFQGFFDQSLQCGLVIYQFCNTRSGVAICCLKHLNTTSLHLCDPSMEVASTQRPLFPFADPFHLDSCID